MAIKKIKKKEKFNYFDAFYRIASFADDEARRIAKIFREWDYDSLNDHRKEMHAIEHFSDLITHDVYTNIVHDFITPIDREDILDLANILDDVVDYIEDVMQRVYMYDIHIIMPEAIQMIDIIANQTTELKLAMEEFPNYTKSKSTLMKHLIAVNDYEEQGDECFINAMHRLFSSDPDPIHLVAWTKTFDRLERCADACEHAADMVVNIIAKNT